MPTDPNQPPGTHGAQAPGRPSWFSDPDSEDIHVFRPSGLWNLSHSAPPATPTAPMTPPLLEPPELLRQPRMVLHLSEPLLTPMEASQETPLLAHQGTPPVQRFVLLPTPSSFSPFLLPLAADHSREAVYQAAMPGLANPLENTGNTPGRQAPTDPLTCNTPLSQLDSAFAPAEAPMPASEQEVEVTLTGAHPALPYADQ